MSAELLKQLQEQTAAIQAQTKENEYSYRDCSDTRVHEYAPPSFFPWL